MTAANPHEVRKTVYDAVAAGWAAAGQSRDRLFFENEVLYENGIAQTPQNHRIPWARGYMRSRGSNITSSGPPGTRGYTTDARMYVDVYVQANDSGMLELDEVCTHIRNALINIRAPGIAIHSAVLKETGGDGKFNIGKVECVFSFDEII